MNQPGGLPSSCLAPAWTPARRAGLHRAVPVLALVACCSLAFALAYFSPVSNASSDPQVSLLLSQAILEHHSVQLDEYRGNNEVVRDGDLVRLDNGHYYYYWPVGTSLFAAPFVWVANRLGKDMSVLEDNFWAQNWLSAFTCAATLAVLYGIGRCYLDWRPSLAIATVSVLGSALLSTMGTALWNINLTVVFVCLALWQIARFDSDQSAGLNPYLLGLLLFSVYLVRASGAVFILGVLAYLLIKSRQLFVKTAVWSLVLLTGFLAFSWMEYGKPLPDYYSLARFQAHTIPAWMVVYGHFLSPSRGILIFSPFFALALGGTLWLLRDRRTRALAWLCLGWFVWSLVVVSRSTRWWGGHSFGPRVLTEVLPALVVLTFLLWQRLSRYASPRARRLAAGGYLALGLVAISINSYQGLMNVNTVRWNGPLAPDVDDYPATALDWRYPQFLASNEALCVRNREHMQRALTDGAIALSTYQPGEEIAFNGVLDKAPLPEAWLIGPYVGRTQRGPAAAEAAIKSLSAVGRRPLTMVRFPLIVRGWESAAVIGWSKAEDQYRWSECRSASIVLNLADLHAVDPAYLLEIRSGSYGRQVIQVLVNGTWIGQMVFPGPQEPPVTRSLPLDGVLLRRNALNEIRFEIPGAVSSGVSDPRSFGLSFQSISIEPMPDTTGMQFQTGQ